MEKKKKSHQKHHVGFGLNHKFHHVGLHLKPSSRACANDSSGSEALWARGYTDWVSKKRMSKEISQMRMESRCGHGSSRCVGELGWGASGLTCLQDEMEKPLAATGESRTGGRGKRWGGTESKLNSATQDQTNLRCLFPRELTFPICGPCGGHTSHCASGEKTETVLCLQVAEWIWSAPQRTFPREAAGQARHLESCTGQKGTQGWNAEEGARNCLVLPSPTVWISSLFSLASPCFFHQGWDIPCFSDE